MDQELKIRLIRSHRHLKKCIDELKWLRDEQDPDIVRLERELAAIHARLVRKSQE